MRKFKKVLKIAAIVFAALILLTVVSGFLFRGKIISAVKKEINKNLTAEVDFKTVNISFLRHFPRVSLGLDELQVVGTGTFSADTLISAKRLDIAVDIMSFIRGSNMNVYNLVLESPRIHALVNKEGEVNWDIVKADEHPQDSSVESKPFNLQLKKYSIKNGYVLYDDREGDMRAEVINLNHFGKGDFTQDIFTLQTTTSADSVTYVYGAVPFLSRVKTNLNTDISIDNTNDTYTFEDLNLSLNELKIKGKGFLKMLGDGYDMDISFDAPNTDFKNILSLVPVVYMKDFEKVQVKGEAAFNGNVKGKYSETTMPAYSIKLLVKDGYFKYPDLPKAVENIQLDVAVDNADGQTDNTVLNISRGHLQVDNQPFNFRLLLKKPMSSMFVDAVAKGNLDLSQVVNFVKLEKGTSLSGLLNADVNVKGNVNDLEKQQYSNFYAAGTVDLSRFEYVSADYPTGVKIHKLNTRFTPVKIDVPVLTGEYLKSNFTANGHINNLLNYMFGGKPLSASLAVAADKINLNDWMGLADTSSSEPTTSPFVVPTNLDVTLNAKVDHLLYDKINISNLGGALKIADGTVMLNNIHGSALDGDITINGSYSTKENKDRPAIAMNYAVNKVDIQKAFYAFNTVQKLMPIGKFLAGKFTSSLSANGKLGSDMNVDMNTLSGVGNVLLIEGFLSKFAPLDKMASALHVAALENISLKDVKAFFEFSNGKLLVKPFTIKVKGIEMEIGGLQGFDQSLNYNVNLKVPRELMGPQANQLVNNLASAVQSKGVPLSVGETVSFKVDMGGTIPNPAIKVNLKESGESLAAQMKDQLQEFAQAKVDSAKVAVKDTLQSIKKQLGDAAKEELKNQLFGKKEQVADSTGEKKNAGEKTKESVKGLLNNLLKKKDTTNKE